MSALDEAIETDASPDEDITDVPVGNSFRDQMLRRAEELRGEQHVDIPIPGYGGGLVARYQLLGYDKVKAIGQRAERKLKDNPRKELYAQVDTLVNACEEILGREPGTDGLVPLSVLWTDRGDVTIRYDDALAAFLGLPSENGTPRTARQILLAAFVNDLAVASHHQEYFLWAQGAREEVNDEVLGESEGTTR